MSEKPTLLCDCCGHKTLGHLAYTVTLVDQEGRWTVCTPRIIEIDGHLKRAELPHNRNPEKFWSKIEGASFPPLLRTTRQNSSCLPPPLSLRATRRLIPLATAGFTYWG